MGDEITQNCAVLYTQMQVRMIDLDDPRNNPEMCSPVATLDYVDFFESSPLGGAPAKSVQTATSRVKEAESLFDNIPTPLVSSLMILPRAAYQKNQRKALHSFLKDLFEVAGSYLSAYISGIPLVPTSLLPTVTIPGENERS